jgi:hypothetical protein
MMTMTTSQEAISDTARRGQRAYADAAQLWADSVQEAVGSLLTPDAKVFDEVVDNYINVAEQVLVTQREFAKSVLAATTPPTVSSRRKVPPRTPPRKRAEPVPESR